MFVSQTCTHWIVSVARRIIPIWIATALTLTNLPITLAETSAPELPRLAGRTLSQWSELINDENRVVRLRAVKTLGAFGSSAKSALIAALSHQDPAVRYTAAVALGRVAAGDFAKTTIADLRRLAADETQPAVQMAAAFALSSHNPTDPSLQILIDRLDYPERGMSCSAAELLGMLGEAGTRAIPALENTVRVHAKNVGDYHRGKAAQNALRKIRPGWEKPGD